MNEWMTHNDLKTLSWDKGSTEKCVCTVGFQSIMKVYHRNDLLKWYFLMASMAIIGTEHRQKAIQSGLEKNKIRVLRWFGSEQSGLGLTLGLVVSSPLFRIHLFLMVKCWDYVKQYVQSGVCSFWWKVKATLKGKLKGWCTSTFCCVRHYWFMTKSWSLRL